MVEVASNCEMDRQETYVDWPNVAFTVFRAMRFEGSVARRVETIGSPRCGG